MGLNGAFHTSASGIRVSQNGLATVSHNIANADTEGYSRQRAEIAGYDPVRIGPNAGYIGRGAYIERISRAEDRFLELQVMRDRTLSGYFEGRETTLAAVERLYVEATEPAIGAAIDDFFNAAREVTADASSFAARLEFIRSAEDTVTGFRTLDRDLRTLQAGLDDQLRAGIDEINALAAEIAELNARIVTAEAGEGHANDFRDRRDQAIRDLSELVEIKTFPQRDGTVSVEITNGYSLVQADQAAHLEGIPRGPGPQGLIDIELVGINGSRLDITGELTKGKMGGLLDVRDNVIQSDLDELDQLAFTFVEEVNNIHRQGFGLDGAGGRDLFVPLAGVQFAAANIAVEQDMVDDPRRVGAALDPAVAPGDNRVLLQLADLQQARHAALGNATFNRRYAEMLHNVGQTARDNGRALDFHQLRKDQSEGLRESVEGVSIDDEMLDLTRFQKHFEANSRVVTTVNALLDTVLQLVG